MNAINPPVNQNPNSSFPDPNSGRPYEQSDENKRYPQNGKVPLPPTRPLAAPLTTDQLYKGAEARYLYPALWKLAMERIGDVKSQPSPMKVTAVGEGDFSRLKTKPWQVNGEEAWEGIKPHK